ncbi:MAG: EF-P beta-lysylation protein EpmB [Porticoccaceae bacterium]
MIPHHTLSGQPTEQMPDWQTELANAVTDITELATLLDLDPATLEPSAAAQAQFPLRVPHAFIARMRKGDPNDPLLLQVLPTDREMLPTPGYSNDPLEEADANPIPGLIHKYQGRVLLVVSPACAIHCRYCFRRHFAYADNTPGRERWQQALAYIAADTSIREVIYSGGDPLAANDQMLLWLTEQIAAIPHIKRLRVHTRLPVVIPARINKACLHWLTATRLQSVVVLHINHGNEIDSPLAQAVAAIRAHGIIVFNQSVLLRDINNCPNILQSLNEKLFDIGVIPYYLHRLDKVAGAADFDISDTEMHAIYRQLLTLDSGYLTPKLVVEIPGHGSKTPLTPIN